MFGELMAQKPVLDEWGRALLWIAFGAGTMFLFLLMGWNPTLLLIAWLVAWAGWVVGRINRGNIDPRGRPRNPP